MQNRASPIRASFKISSLSAFPTTSFTSYFFASTTTQAMPEAIISVYAADPTSPNPAMTAWPICSLFTSSSSWTARRIASALPNKKSEVVASISSEGSAVR